MKRTLIISLVALGAATAGAQHPGPPSHPGRLLAPSCFQCHGTDGRGGGTFERLAGKSATGICGDLRYMKAENKRGETMTIHALGYAGVQLRGIADHFSKPLR